MDHWFDQETNQFRQKHPYIPIRIGQRFSVTHPKTVVSNWDLAPEQKVSSLTCVEAANLGEKSWLYEPESRDTQNQDD